MAEIVIKLSKEELIALTDKLREAPAVPVQELQGIEDDKEIAYITNKDLSKIIKNIVRLESDVVKISSQLGISLVHHNDA